MLILGQTAKTTSKQIDFFSIHFEKKLKKSKFFFVLKVNRKNINYAYHSAEIF
jgi:hypothetical protein